MLNEIKIYMIFSKSHNLFINRYLEFSKYPEVCPDSSGIFLKKKDTKYYVSRLRKRYPKIKLIILSGIIKVSDR